MNRMRLAGRWAWGWVVACTLASANPALAEIRYADAASATPAAPYTTWETAAATIQDAVDAAAAGDTVLVADGVYDRGGRAAYGTMTNRVAVTKAITVRSVNGAGAATILGQGPNGPGAIRCAYVTNGAALIGFTLAGGATRTSGDTTRERSGGGVWCAPAGVVEDCVISGNSANQYAGGTYYGTIRRCVISGNSAGVYGGGAYFGLLQSCLLKANTAAYGAGCYSATGESCTVVGNAATTRGGGTHGATIRGSVVYRNTAPTSPNFYSGSFVASCTHPAAGGTGNITNDPQFVEAAAGNYRLGPVSPCIEKGTNLAWMAAGTDLDGNPRIMQARSDMGAYEYLWRPVLVVTPSSASNTVLTGGSVPARTVQIWNGGTGTVAYTVSSSESWVSASPSAGASTGEHDVITLSYSPATLAPGLYTAVVSVESADAGNSPQAVAVTLWVRDAATRYVDAASAAPADPYATWETAASTIQDAVDVALDGDTVLVADGVYDRGGRAAYGTMTNRVAVTRLVTVRSVNGAGAATIVGQGPNGPGAIRCAYVTNGAALVGFTLTGGATRTSGDAARERSGGGAWCVAGAVLDDCVVSGNSASLYGGGTYYGTLRRCRVTDNAAGTYGGGTYYGVAQSSLFKGNAAGYGGGAYYATIDESTVVANTATNSGGGTHSGTIRGSIVYLNAAPTYPNYRSGSLLASCVYPSASGSGNITNDPRFADADAGNYRLLPVSPCIERGTNLPWTAGATDLDGSPRVVRFRADMGAYEYLWQPAVVVSPSLVTNMVLVGGTATGQVFEVWNGGTNTMPYTITAGASWLSAVPPSGDSTGEHDRITLSYSTAALAPGMYTATVSVSSAAAWNSPQAVEVRMLVRPPVTRYVNRANATPAWPYLTWATAATNIEAAIGVALDADTVLVTNGVYGLTNQLVIAKAIAVRSAGGARDTELAGLYPARTSRVVLLANAGAVLDGFTVRNGFARGTGSAGQGGGVYLAAGLLDRCIVRGNVATNGGGVYCTATGTVSGCLIEGNTASVGGGGVYSLSNGTVRSSTIVGNAAQRGGGLYNAAGRVQNTILYFNTATILASANYTNAGAVFSYSNCCAYPLLSGRPELVSGNIADDPRLLTDHRLSAVSPCRDTGLGQSWMTGAPDLAGNPRIANGTVDRGAYEYGPGALSCSVAPDKTAGSLWGPLSNFVFTVSANGSDAASLWYRWDFDENGSAEFAGPAYASAVRSYGRSGVYSVSVTASNSLGEVASARWEGPLTIASYYVNRANATPQAPYTNPATAALTITNAVAAALNGTVVLVADGLYTNRGLGAITLDKSVTLASLNGPLAAEIRPGLVITAPRAAVEGFRLNGSSAVKGGRAQVVEVRAPDAAIRGNVIEYADRYVLAAAGVAENLAFERNVCRFSWYRGMDLRPNRGIGVRGNMFQKHGVSGDALVGFVAEDNLFVGADSTAGSARMLEFSNVTDAVVLRNNNILYNVGPAVVHGGGGALIVATNNWWGTVDGPRDDDGSIEVAAGDADPGVAAARNAEPAGALGPLCSDDGAAGSSRIDYFPWAAAQASTPHAVPPPTVYIDRQYTPGSCDGHAWGVDAFASIQAAIDAGMYWDGGCLGHVTVHVPEDFATIQEGIAAAPALDSAKGSNFLATVLVRPNTRDGGIYTNGWNEALNGFNPWALDKRGMTVRAEPITNVTVAGGFCFGSSSYARDVTLQGFNIVTGSHLLGAVYFNSASNCTLRDCSITRASYQPSHVNAGYNCRWIHNYFGRAYTMQINPMTLTGEIISNYFDGVSLNVAQADMTIAYNTFAGGSGLVLGWWAGGAYEPFAQVPRTPQVHYNNFVDGVAGGPGIQIDVRDTLGRDLYNSYRALAENNWWGSTNGPLDPLGDEEVGPDTVVIPSMSNQLNALPESPDIGVGLYSSEATPRRTWAGVSNISYVPWLSEPVDNGWPTNTRPLNVWVDPQYTPGGPDGQYFGGAAYEWGVNAFAGIQDAVDAVYQQNGRVWLAPEDSFVLTNTVVVSGAVTIYGSRDTGTVGAAVCMDAAVAARCFVLDHADAALVGLIVSNGYAAGAGYDGCGGGVFFNTLPRNSYLHAPKLVACAIRDNRADVAGGGVFARGAATAGLVVNACAIERNAAASGGGVYSERGLFPLNTVIAGNFATNGGGGGLVAGPYVRGSSTVYDSLITNALIAWNTATEAGGGAYFPRAFDARGWVVMSNQTLAGPGGGLFLTGGSATDLSVLGNVSGSDGGGIAGETGSVTACAIAHNAALTGDGGGVRLEGGTLSQCTIRGNVAGGAGGGAWLGKGAIVRSSLVTGNSGGGSGGGLYLAATTGKVENCTVTANDATQGGGIAAMQGLVRNAIVTGNGAENWWLGSGGGITVEYSCTPQDLTAYGAGNTVLDPQFVDAMGQDYRLLAVSPCVDQGTNQSWMASAKDLDGNARIVNGRVDMGAYEFVGAPMAPAAPTMAMMRVKPAAVADADRDGLPDAWESQYAKTATAIEAGSDDDGDGLSNWAEYVAGTDPKDKDSGLWTAPSIENGSIVLRWPSQAGRRYIVERGTSMSTGFAPLEQGIEATPPVNEFVDPVDGPGPFFYRVTVGQ